MSDKRIINNKLYDIMLNTQHTLISNGLIDYTSAIYKSANLDNMEMKFAISLDRASHSHDWRGIVEVLDYEVKTGYGWSLSRVIYDSVARTDEYLIGCITVWDKLSQGEGVVNGIFE